MTRSIHIPSAIGRLSAYLAEPDERPRAALLIIHEIYGVNADIRRKCDVLAQQGYLVVAPDLFWRLEPGVELDPEIASTKERALALARRFDSDAGIRDIQATIAKVRELVGNNTRVGLIGYSLGGRMAALAVARTDIDAAVGYYGVRLQMVFGEADAISHPLMLHIAELDDYVDRETQVRLHRVFHKHPKVTLHDYPGQHHDFAYEFGSLRADDAARRADQRTMAFLQTNLMLYDPPDLV